MEEIIIKELVFNPNIVVGCWLCKEEIPQDYLKIKIDREHPQKRDDLLKGGFTATSQASILSGIRVAKPKNKKGYSMGSFICTKCFFEAIEYKRELIENFEREVNNWIKANEGRLLAKKL